MGKYLLDTCTWIEYFHDRNGVSEHAQAAGRKNLCASEVTLAELTYGAIRSGNYERHIKEPQRLRTDVTIYDISEVFEEYGQIRCALKKIRKDLDREVGQFDMLIGATALHYGLTVVTDNIKHFSLMPGVKYENWVERNE
ncbi:MAG: PIN domain-containing protein [Prevotella sp.]|nr:PIN domain-containing protein [Prevotella sp.]MBO5628284.1 PIN domain-containing protein [Aeriscardovia sp.]